MTILVSKVLAGLAALALLIGGLLSMTVQDLSLGSAGEIPALQGMATTTEVGPDEVITIFSSNANCSSRVVTTTDGTGQEIRVLFGAPTNGDVTTPTATVGHFQTASTTVAYDSGLYGCGAWKAYADASTTLLIAEFN